jgi:hypothetical protein
MIHMAKATILLLSVICALSASAGNSRRSNLRESQQEIGNMDLTKQSAIKVTIATVGPMLGPPTDRYRVGEQIPVIIKLTNTSTQPTYACVSSDLYQDLPKLTKNGDLLPYTKWQSDLLRNDQKDRTCQNCDLPESLLLRSNEPTVVDFLIIVDNSQLPTGAQSWYDQLTPGAYELSIQRRFDCCDGPLVESNKISFEVVP